MHSWPSKAQAGFQLLLTLSCPCAMNDSHHGGPGPGSPRHGLPSNEWSLSLPDPVLRKLPFTVAIKYESHSRKHLAHHCGYLSLISHLLRVIWWEVRGITDGGERGKEGSQTKDYFLPLSTNQPAIPCHLSDFAVDKCEGDQSCRAHPPGSLLGMLMTLGSTTEWDRPPRS